jgi:hypothetical protein
VLDAQFGQECLQRAEGALVAIAWRYLGLFAGVIAPLVLEPLPLAAAGLIGVSLAKDGSAERLRAKCG